MPGRGRRRPGAAARWSGRRARDRESRRRGAARRRPQVGRPGDKGREGLVGVGRGLTFAGVGGGLGGEGGPSRAARSMSPAGRALWAGR